MGPFKTLFKRQIKERQNMNKDQRRWGMRITSKDYFNEYISEDGLTLSALSSKINARYQFVTQQLGEQSAMKLIKFITNPTISTHLLSEQEKYVIHCMDVFIPIGLKPIKRKNVHLEDNLYTDDGEITIDHLL